MSRKLTKQKALVQAVVKDLNRVCAKVFRSHLTTENVPTPRDLISVVTAAMIEFHCTHLRRLVADAEANEIDRPSEYLAGVVEMMARHLGLVEKTKTKKDDLN